MLSALNRKLKPATVTEIGRQIRTVGGNPAPFADKHGPERSFRHVVVLVLFFFKDRDEENRVHRR